MSNSSGSPLRPRSSPSVWPQTRALSPGARVTRNKPIFPRHGSSKKLTIISRCGFTRTPLRVSRRTWIDPPPYVLTVTGVTAEAASSSVSLRALGASSRVNSILDGVTVSASGGEPPEAASGRARSNRSAGAQPVRQVPIASLFQGHPAGRTCSARTLRALRRRARHRRAAVPPVPHQCFEQAPLPLVAERAQLGVPLHADQERVAVGLDRLDDTVGAPRDGAQPLPQAADRLMVHGVH